MFGRVGPSVHGAAYCSPFLQIPSKIVFFDAKANGGRRGIRSFGGQPFTSKQEKAPTREWVGPFAREIGMVYLVIKTLRVVVPFAEANCTR